VLHGCGGPDSHHRGWAEKLASWGYVAITPDSFGSRGHESICEKTSLVPAKLRVADVVGTANFLSAQPYVAKDRIGVIGFSHGGWTIMKGTQADAPWSAHGIKGAVAYYPYCDAAADQNVAMPLLIVMGDKDDWTPSGRCKRLQTRLGQPGLVEAVYYPDAYHSFDRQQPTTFVGGVGNDGVVRQRRVEFNAGAARDAEARTRAFFDRLLR
jgi:dienelactone hydrolase